MLMFLPVVSSCEVASGAFCPKAEDARSKARFQAPTTGLALDNGALSALHREKADHTPHDHTTTSLGAGERLPAVTVSTPRAGAKTSVEEPPVAVQATDPLNCELCRAR